ncbi:hypothetical protein [Aureivirga sp. CE67]|uniref:hypothetical protein n=1 Tax=Aureivirga sp. CE67 TaxID=1788983 RepID=UPI0018C9621C|nr:hypothetical protein [Aureivirga sp. CE67]
MKNLLAGIFIFGLLVNFTSCKPKTEKVETEEDVTIVQHYSEYPPTYHHELALEVLDASMEWIGNFNKGNVQGCVDGYTDNAEMSALPFGIKKGKEEISEFWTSLVKKSGAKNIVYTNVSVEIASKNIAFLSANWSMNIGEGIIFQEKWEKINGKWILTYDNFQVLEQYKSPKKNPTNPVGDHLHLKTIINNSKKWIEDFNSGKGEILRESYTSDARLNATPFENIDGNEGIQKFWSKMISDGANNLTFHNPTFKIKTKNSAYISSRWSLNIGEGKIYQEKWDLVDGKWKMSYDEFRMFKKY